MAEKPISPEIEYASVGCHQFPTNNCSFHLREPPADDWLDDDARRLIEFSSFGRWPPRPYGEDDDDDEPAAAAAASPSHMRNSVAMTDEFDLSVIGSRSGSVRGHLPPKKRNKTSSSSTSSKSSHGTALKKRNVGQPTTDVADVQQESRPASERHRRGPANSSTSTATHPCPECHKVFGSTGKLQQHLYVHSGERPFVCDKCSKGFSSRFKLMRHALIHAPPGERRYKCSCCERSFHRKDHLKNHAHVHDPQKATYKCHECPKEYNSRLSYRKHVAVHAAHSGDLECKVCLKRFASTDEIVFHLKVHSGSRTIKTPSEKKFKCDFCERRFFTRKDVKRHLVVHTGRRDFLCQICPQRFGRKDHLVRHIKKSHHEHHRYHHHHHHHHHVHNSHHPVSDKEAVASSGNSSSANVIQPRSGDDLATSNASDLEQLDLVLRPQPLDGHCDSRTMSMMPSSSSAFAVHSLPSTDMEYKLYQDDVKVERDEDVDPIDIGQLFGLLPLSTPTSPPHMSHPQSLHHHHHQLQHYHHQHLHHQLHSLSAATVIQGMSDGVGHVMLAPHIVTTDQDDRVLPQFDQAFQ